MNLLNASALLALTIIAAPVTAQAPRTGVVLRVEVSGVAGRDSADVVAALRNVVDTDSVHGVVERPVSSESARSAGTASLKPAAILILFESDAFGPSRMLRWRASQVSDGKVIGTQMEQVAPGASLADAAAAGTRRFLAKLAARSKQGS